MTERKFTDEEVIKALECLAFTEGSCVGCIYQSAPFPTCRELVARQTLDLINRQRAEIESLNEIVFTDRTEAIKTLKAEAIKEFAERVIDLIYEADDVAPLTEWQIRDLAKELTEGKPCTEGADCFAAEGEE